MHFNKNPYFYAAALTATALASTTLEPPMFPPPTLPPTLTPLFTVTTEASEAQNPIPQLLGGYQSVYPILGGSIEGPALNGTIHQGSATPHVTDDGVFAFSVRSYSGNTSDGEDFLIQQRGVGHWTREQTWLTITIGGEYAYLRHVFLLAQSDVDFATKVGKVTVYGVNMQDQISSLK